MAVSLFVFSRLIYLLLLLLLILFLLLQFDCFSYLFSAVFSLVHVACRLYLLLKFSHNSAATHTSIVWRHMDSWKSCNQISITTNYNPELFSQIIQMLLLFKQQLLHYHQYQHYFYYFTITTTTTTLFIPTNHR